MAWRGLINRHPWCHLQKPFIAINCWITFLGSDRCSKENIDLVWPTDVKGHCTMHLTDLWPPLSSVRLSFHTPLKATLTSRPSNTPWPSIGDSLALVPGNRVEKIEPKSCKLFDIVMSQCITVDPYLSSCLDYLNYVDNDCSIRVFCSVCKFICTFWLFEHTQDSMSSDKRGSTVYWYTVLNTLI